MNEQPANTITIDIEEYIQLRRAAELNTYLVDNIRHFDDMYRDLHERLNNLERELRERR